MILSVFILLLDILIVIIGLEHLLYVFVRLTAVTIAVFRQGIPVIFRFVFVKQIVIDVIIP